MATAANGALSVAAETRRHDDPEVRVDPFLSPRLSGSQRATVIADELGWHGPCRAPATACAAGNDALAEAMDLIRFGRCDVVVAGGTDAPLSGPYAASLDRLAVVAGARHGPCHP
ncbi:MAG: beta-ketoacyl synthase N-terminal-like domain-containing protein, partial [Actinomycetota bacterium]